MKKVNISEVASIASGQWGMVSTAQAVLAGVSAVAIARLAASGQLERMVHGIYRMAGTPPGVHDELRAAWLAIDPGLTTSERVAQGPRDVVSHRSAAVLHGLGDVADEMLEFTSSVRRQSRRGDVCFHRASLDEGDWQLVDGLPVTTPLRTIADLARSHLDRGHLAGVTRDAVLRSSKIAPQLALKLAPFARSLGLIAGDGRDVVDLLLREGGLPQSTLDLVWRDTSTIVQVDYEAHGGR